MNYTKEDKQKSVDSLSFSSGLLTVDMRATMRSKTKFFWLPLLLAMMMLLSCSAEDVVSIQIVNVIGDQPDEQCMLTTGSAIQKSKGSLNFSIPESLGRYPQYYLALKIQSSLESEESTAGGTTVQPSSRNDFYLSDLIVDYQCQDEASRCRGFPNISSQVTPIAGTVRAGGELSMGVTLFTITSAETIGAFLGESEGINVNAVIKLKGKFANGSQKEVPEFSFPLFIYRKAIPNYDLTKYEPAVAEGSEGPACNNWGQDGAVPTFVCRADCGGCGTGQKCDTDTCSCASNE